MGYALRFPGLVLTNPTAKKILTEPFGVPGLTHHYDPRTFVGAVGSVITTSWLNKVLGGADATVSMTPRIGSPIAGQPMVDMRTDANSEFKVENVNALGGTVIAVFDAVNTGYKLFEAYGRRISVFNAGYQIESTAYVSTDPRLPIPFSAVPAPPSGSLTAIIGRFSEDSSADKLTVLRTGVRGDAAGQTTRSTNKRLYLGPGPKTAGHGPTFAAFGVYSRMLTDAEVTNTVLPALSARFGITV